MSARRALLISLALGPLGMGGIGACERSTPAPRPTTPAGPTPKRETRPLTPVVAPYPAPDFTLEDLAGNKVTLSDLRGHVVVLLFFATSVKPAYQMIPVVNEMLDRLPDAEAVGLSLDQGASDRVRTFMKELQPAFPVCLFDYEVAKAYGNVEDVPTTFIIDPQGRVRYHQKGYAEADSLEAAVRASAGTVE